MTTATTKKPAAPKGVTKPDSLGVQHARKAAASKPARKRAVAATADRPTKADKPLTGRAAAEASAREGNVPLPPDFSAKTHHRFLKRHAELVSMVEAGDVKGLKAYQINPISSSPKALARYRDLAVMALEARARIAKAKA